jgi:hypothetical protein
MDGVGGAAVKGGDVAIYVRSGLLFQRVGVAPLHVDDEVTGQRVCIPSTAHLCGRVLRTTGPTGSMLRACLLVPWCFSAR